ncbi:pyridoxal phosphate-dependent decarboxylase family protein [Asanoa siamensis]|uniref:L-2,4-diaminobutyrate decarboxylase n=1 Tax=Asanoa siamensis TaxID=926357 RepID=A0ABQ4CY57_9ACTN|nr:aminotransferase class V-fold PLP-dependent enzyme [Asanoa siamensis]GIF76219.1 L-2,4-diaminobutyrate decarboxylase [Asanoa siamensis]
MSFPLDLEPETVDHLGRRAVEFVTNYLRALPTEPVSHFADADRLVGELLGPPPEKPGDLGDLLSTLGTAAGYGLNPAAGGYLAYFPAGGLPSAAIAEMVAQTLNRFTAFAALAPGLVAMEQGIIRWLCVELGLPAGSSGLVLSGGSMANLVAIVAARDDRLTGDPRRGVVYVTEHTHYSVSKAAHLAGLEDSQLRVVPTRDDMRMNPTATAEQIAIDRAAGLYPFLLVATAGATSTGLVDPLDELGRLARREDLWFHVDGAYGAPYQLTERGRALLAGIEDADSIVLDPHKSMFLPYGTGMLLVRDERTLRAAHAGDGDYLQDIGGVAELPDYAALGPELSREWRGLRLWLPLQLHGVAAFREALDEKLDLARSLYRALAAEPRLELPWEPDLTVVGFRLRDAGPDAAAIHRRLLDRINGTGRIFLSSTKIGGRYTVRLCPQGLRTSAAHVAEAIDLIRSAVHDV